MHTLAKINVVVIVTLAVGLFLIWLSMGESERFLRPIKKGMSQSQVQSLVGSPLSIIKCTNGTNAWIYSRWWTGDAVVYFDTNRVVSAVETD